MAVEHRRPAAVTPAANLATLIEICACPDCYADLEGSGSGLRCTRCGRTYEVRRGIPILLPSTSDATEERYLANYDAIASADLDKPFEGNRAARHQKLKEFVGSVDGKRVLDIGSSDAMYLREMRAPRKVALDIAIEYLLEIPEESGVVAVCGNAEHLPIKPHCFDVVIISDVLEHVLHPELVAQNLERISGDDTRVIVHVPWEEDLSQYRDVPYEFTHLRSFNAYNFGLLFSAFYERRSRGTYPYLNMPLHFRLYGRVPRSVYNTLMFAHRRWLGPFMNERWERWVAELPRREAWLLLFYKPIYRQFELRLWKGTLRHRFARWLRSRLKRPAG